jgi:hypothetical protein
MTSGNTAQATSQTLETTSGNTNRRAGRTPTPLAAPYDQALTGYAATLAAAPIAESSRAKYASRVRGYLAWLAGTDVDGDPLPTRRPGTVRCATTGPG